MFVGNLSKNSYTRLVANTLGTLAPVSFELEFVELGNLEMYNQDLDDEGIPPASWILFRENVKKMESFLFITPEYKWTVPAVLKNALDIGSRPVGQSVWDGKPGAVISVSPGGTGAFEANHHLRHSLVFLNIPELQQPEAYIGNVNSLYDSKGKLVNYKSHEFYKVIIVPFVAWINNNVDA